MPVVSDAPGQLYINAWITLLAIFALFILVGVVLRWRPYATVRVTRYEPPEGISPGIAAFLFENGRYERSFAAALISLAAKGYIKILQNKDWFTLQKLRDTDTQLPAEESTILLTLFPNAFRSYPFNSSDSAQLFDSYRDFRSTVHQLVIGQLVSTHVAIWIIGIVCSLTVLNPVVSAMPTVGNGLSLASIGFLSVLIIAGGSCFVSAIRIWPATIMKIAAFFVPGGRVPKRPLNVNDAIPILLSGTATLGFVFLAVLTSTKFASLAVGILVLNIISKRLLNAPTNAGRKALAELWAFREFLSKTEADRLNRLNQPGKTPDALDFHISYGVALGVERGWGEEFVTNILEMLQVDRAYNGLGELPIPDNTSASLNLFDKKR